MLCCTRVLLTRSTRASLVYGHVSLNSIISCSRPTFTQRIARRLPPLRVTHGQSNLRASEIIPNNYCTLHWGSRRFLSTESDSDRQKELEDKKSSLFQRFKDAYAVYGKVVISVHFVTSCFWFAGAYLTALSGFNLLQIFESVHFPDWMCRPLRLGGGSVNQWATALIVYKLLAPLRYGSTLILTRYVVRYLRAKGKAPVVTEQTRISTLVKESAQLSRDRLRLRLKKERSRAKRSLMSKYRR